MGRENTRSTSSTSPARSDFFPPHEPNPRVEVDEPCSLCKVVPRSSAQETHQKAWAECFLPVLFDILRGVCVLSGSNLWSRSAGRLMAQSMGRRRGQSSGLSARIQFFETNTLHCKSFLECSRIQTLILRLCEFSQMQPILPDTVKHEERSHEPCSPGQLQLAGFLTLAGADATQEPAKSLVSADPAHIRMNDIDFLNYPWSAGEDLVTD